MMECPGSTSYEQVEDGDSGTCGGRCPPDVDACTVNPANYVVGEGELTGSTDSGAAGTTDEAVTTATFRPVFVRQYRALADAWAPRAMRVRPCECRL